MKQSINKVRSKDLGKQGVYKDPKFLNHWYWQKGYSMADIAKMLGVGQLTIFRWMKKLGIPTRTQAESARTERKRAKFIGNTFGLGMKHTEATKRKISEAHKGKYIEENNPHWKGGTFKDSRGYVLVKRQSHPRANSLGYIYEHRLVAEEKLGRSLDAKEIPHHRNGVKSDNRWENLYVFLNNSDHTRYEWFLKRDTLQLERVAA